MARAVKPNTFNQRSGFSLNGGTRSCSTSCAERPATKSSYSPGLSCCSSSNGTRAAVGAACQLRRRVVVAETAVDPLQLLGVRQLGVNQVGVAVYTGEATVHGVGKHLRVDVDRHLLAGDLGGGFLVVVAHEAVLVLLCRGCREYRHDDG